MYVPRRGSQDAAWRESHASSDVEGPGRYVRSVGYGTVQVLVRRGGPGSRSCIVGFVERADTMYNQVRCVTFHFFLSFFGFSVSPAPAAPGMNTPGWLRAAPGPTKSPWALTATLLGRPLPSSYMRSFFRRYLRRQMQAPVQIPAMPTTTTTMKMTHCQCVDSLERVRDEHARQAKGTYQSPPPCVEPLEPLFDEPLVDAGLAAFLPSQKPVNHCWRPFNPAASQLPAQTSAALVLRGWSTL